MRNILRKELLLSSSPLAFFFIAFGLMFLLPGYPVLCGAFFVTLGLLQSFQTAREASDAICRETGADGVSCVGGTFVIYRKSKKLEQERAKAKARERAAKKVNPVREGKQRRRAQAKRARQRKNEFFRQQREKDRGGTV